MKTKPEPSSRPFAYRSRRLACDGADLTKLAEDYGTPLYVYSAAQIRYRFDLFQQAFSNSREEKTTRPHTVCYAVKANSSLAIMRLLGERGAGFDIVSGGELERVRRAHKPALRKVVFSGVGKQIWEIDAALKANILLFNVESESEIALLAVRAQALGIRARFALRVNPDVFAKTHPYISTGLSDHKFGIAIGLARALYREAAKSKWLDAAGVSVHIGSQIREVDPFAAALQRVVNLIGELQQDGHSIRYIDAGGGLGIDYEDAAMVPTFSASAAVASYASALNSALSTLPAKVHLLLEPGRFLVAQAGGLLTRVLVVKKNGAKVFVVTDAGMNDLIRPALYDAYHQILPVVQPRRSASAQAPVDIVGPVCESGDFFAHDRPMPPVKPGDLVLLLDAGAYGMSQASNYNTRTRAAEVLIDPDLDGRNEVCLIRRRETLKDLLASEMVR